MVEYLMKSGASVHARDRNHDTPLLCAIKACHRDVIRSLVACGGTYTYLTYIFKKSFLNS